MGYTAMSVKPTSLRLIACDIIAAASVITPIRPMYIRTMTMILPANDSPDVMPRLIPTVPRAEVASNSI